MKLPLFLPPFPFILSQVCMLIGFYLGVMVFRGQNQIFQSVTVGSFILIISKLNVLIFEVIFLPLVFELLDLYSPGEHIYLFWVHSRQHGLQWNKSYSVYSTVICCLLITMLKNVFFSFFLQHRIKHRIHSCKLKHWLKWFFLFHMIFWISSKGMFRKYVQNVEPLEPSFKCSSSLFLTCRTGSWRILYSTFQWKSEKTLDLVCSPIPCLFMLLHPWILAI